MVEKEKGYGFVSEFKQFITRGNVMDLAVGVIIGGAFQSIVNSLVNDIFMPFQNIKRISSQTLRSSTIDKTFFWRYILSWRKPM